MIVKSFSDLENYLKYLDSEESEKTLKTVSFMIVKQLSEQNKVDMVTVLKKFVSFLSEDNNAKLIYEIDSLISSQLIVNQEKIIEPPPPEPSINYQNNFQSRVGNFNHNLKANMTLPISNTINDANLPRPVAPPPPVRSRAEERSLATRNFIHINEGVKFLVPALTTRGNKALVDLSTPMESYALLKLINGKDTLDKIFMNTSTDSSNNHMLIGSDMKTLVKDMQGHFVISFIEKIVKLYREGYITCVRTSNLPYDKNFKMRLGDLIVYMGLISQEKLEKTIEFQKSGRVIGPVENNFGVYNNNQKNNRLLIGDLLLSMNLINKTQLEKALLVQKWYNNIT